MIVGRITRVDGVRASAVFYERLQPYLVSGGEAVSSPKLNSYVKTGVGLDTVICQITGEHEAEFDKKGEVNRADSAAPIGAFIVDLEVRGHIADGVFKGGLRCLPIVGASVQTLSAEELSLMYSQQTSKTISIGHSIYDETQDVFLDVNKLMASHIGIFGNTGSGKSNTLASIITNYVSSFNGKHERARIIIFDLNNEYGRDAIVPESMKSIFRLNTRTRNNSSTNKVPLDIDGLDEDSWGTILRASQKTQMPVVRRAFRRWKNSRERFASEFIGELKQSLVDKKSVVFFTLRNYCLEYINGIEELCFHNKQQTFYYTGRDTDGFINALEDIDEIALSNEVDRFTEFYLWLTMEAAHAAESGINFDFIQPLLPRAKHVIKDLEKIFIDTQSAKISSLFKEHSVVVVQLGNVNAASREMLPPLIAELIMKEASVDKGDGLPESITTIVIDEAHNLLSHDSLASDPVHENTLKVFERVIKEGRKFGVFLCLASQRPSDISPTITSQIHNYFIHKLVNPNDIERIRKTVSFMGESSLSMLSALGQGECIISGPALYMPQYVYVNQLDKNRRPNSNDIKLFGSDGILE